MSLIPNNLTPFACARITNSNSVKSAVPNNLIKKLLKTNCIHSQNKHFINFKKITNNSLSLQVGQITKLAWESLLEQ